MKKYYIWYDNGTGYLDSAGTIEAGSKAEAAATATKLFGHAQAEYVVLTTERDPNVRYPDRTVAARKRRERRLRGEAVRNVQAGDNIVISLGTPLPCAVRDCANMATAAHAWRKLDDATPGLWIVQPICKDCTLKSLQIYAKN